jgi:hypothetical protein
VKKIIALLAGITLVGLTACGQVNSAVTIGTETISQTELQKTLDTIASEREAVDTTGLTLDSGATLTRGQLQFIIITHIFDAIAKDLGVKISTTEIATTRADMISQSGGEEALAKNLVSAQIASFNFDKYVRAIVISDKLSQAIIATGVAEADVSAQVSSLVTRKASELNIKINPRYGTWDNSTGEIVATDSAGDAVTSTK